jgi:hypothetical protein
MQYHIEETKAVAKMVESVKLARSASVDDSHPFADIVVPFKLPDNMVHKSDETENGRKFFVGPDAIRALGKNYIVYAAGTAGAVNFEEYMGRFVTFLSTTKIVSRSFFIFAFRTTTPPPARQFFRGA